MIDERDACSFIPIYGDKAKPLLNKARGHLTYIFSVYFASSDEFMGGEYVKSRISA